MRPWQARLTAALLCLALPAAAWSNPPGDAPAPPEAAEPPEQDVPPPAGPAGDPSPEAAAPPASAPPASAPPPPAYAEVRPAPLAAGPAPWERAVLEAGPISRESWVLGGIFGTWIGFGLGHAVQGRWGDDDGALYTGGELISLTLFGFGMARATAGEVVCSDAGCRSRSDQNQQLWATLAVVGGVGFGVLRIAEIIDVWGGVSTWNKRYEQVRSRHPGWSLSLLPGPGGGSVGFHARF